MLSLVVFQRRLNRYRTGTQLRAVDLSSQRAPDTTVNYPAQNGAAVAAPAAARSNESCWASLLELRRRHLVTLPRLQQACCQTYLESARLRFRWVDTKRLQCFRIEHMTPSDLIADKQSDFFDGLLLH